MGFRMPLGREETVMGKLRSMRSTHPKTEKIGEKPIAAGDLETRLANEQPIPFSVETKAPFLKFVANAGVQYRWAITRLDRQVGCYFFAGGRNTKITDFD